MRDAIMILGGIVVVGLLAYYGLHTLATQPLGGFPYDYQ